jgi:hypothetical protein
VNSTDFLVHGVAFRMTKESFKHKNTKVNLFTKNVIVERHLFRWPRQKREAEASINLGLRRFVRYRVRRAQLAQKSIRVRESMLVRKMHSVLSVLHCNLSALVLLVVVGAVGAIDGRIFNVSLCYVRNYCLHTPCTVPNVFLARTLDFSLREKSPIRFFLLAFVRTSF